MSVRKSSTMTHCLPEAARAEKRKTPPTRNLSRAGDSRSILPLRTNPFLVTLYTSSTRGLLFHFSSASPIPRPRPTLGSPVSAHIAMSLTSRVFGLFSTTATSDPTATTAGDLPASKDTQTASGFHHEIGTRSAARHAREEALFEEEPRPPYLHVRSMLDGKQYDIRWLT